MAPRPDTPTFTVSEAANFLQVRIDHNDVTEIRAAAGWFNKRKIIFEFIPYIPRTRFSGPVPPGPGRRLGATHICTVIIPEQYIIEPYVVGETVGEEFCLLWKYFKDPNYVPTAQPEPVQVVRRKGLFGLLDQIKRSPQ